MSAPRLWRRLTLETPVRTPDGMGGWNLSWTPLGVLWADMAPRTGGEAALGGRVGALQGWRISLRGAPPGSPRRPRPDQRLRDGARVFNLISVAEADPRGRYLICLAEEELA